MRHGFRLLLAAALVTACGATPARPAASPSGKAPAATASADEGAFVDAATWSTYKKADYAIVAPRKFHRALEPLARHRAAEGHTVALIAVEDAIGRAEKPDAEALRDALRRIAKNGALAYVFLVGDTRHATDSDPAEVPTFYLPKVGYENHGKEHHAPYEDAQADHDTYPTDFPYTDLGAAKPAAVGRLPARSTQDVEAFVRKVQSYEAAAQTGAWQRRVDVIAGPANFGALADGMIESIATQMLDEELSYDYDVSFTFAKADSAYAFPFDKLRDKWKRDMGDGALVAAYVGHGAFDTLDWARFGRERWDIARAEDADALRISAGKPLFFSIACNTGAYDRPYGRASLAERMILNEGGPIGVFASSRESHPYPNALYGRAIVTELVNRKPKTIGDGIADVRAAMKRSDIPFATLLVAQDTGALKREHEGLYNLLGDPATPLRYPEPVTLRVPGHVAGGGAIGVEIQAEKATKGRALVTLETRRRVMKDALVSPATVAEMPRDRAFSTMSENYVKANDKVIARTEVDVAGGKGVAKFDAPKDPGDYVVKVLLTAPSRTAAGHANVTVDRSP